MRIAKSPLAVPMFRQTRKEAALRSLMPLLVHDDLMPGTRYHNEVRRERIDTQILSPTQLDVLDRAPEAIDSLSRRLAVWKFKPSLRRHEKGWAVSKVLLPGRGTFLRDVTRHIGNKTAHLLLDGCLLCHGERC